MSEVTSGRIVARSSERLITFLSKPTPYLPSLIRATPPSVSARSHHLWWQVSKRACCHEVFLCVSLSIKPAEVSQSAFLVKTLQLNSAFASLCFSFYSTIFSTSTPLLLLNRRIIIVHVELSVLSSVKKEAHSLSFSKSESGFETVISICLSL